MKKLVALLAGVTLLSACGAEQTVKSDALLHHHFVLVKANGNEIKTDMDMNSPYLEFGENFKINGRMCNNFFGQANYEKGVLSSQGLASTKMLCPDDQLNRLDNVIADVFQEGAKVSMKEDILTLKSGKNTLIYELKDRVN